MSDKKRSFAPVVLRIGICLVYLWFGLNQLLNPSAWTIYLPGYTNLLPVSPEGIVAFNGVIEVVLALFLLIGWKVRFFATLLAVHAFHILTTVGYSAIGVRDFAIFVAVLSVALHGADRWCIGAKQEPAQITI